MRHTHGTTPIALSGFKTQHTIPELTLTVPCGTCMALLDIDADAEYFSLLTRSLAGHTPSCGGTLHVEENDVTHAPPGQRHLGTLDQNTPLFSHLTVKENITLPLRADTQLSLPEKQYRVTEMLALMGLDRVQSLMPSALTAELTFRACLARLLVLRPEAVILNTPFTGMDQATTMRLLSLTEKLRHAIGLSVLLLTHNRTEALMAADTIGVIKNRTLLQTGTAETLLNRPDHENVVTALGDANTLTGKVMSLEDDCAVLRLPSGETVEAMAGTDLKEGDLATICVLPERLSVIFPRNTADTPSDDPGMLSCTLISARHTGNTIHMRFRLSDSTEIIACRPPVHQPRDLQPGRKALLAWQISSATAFPMDQKPYKS